MPPPVVTRFAPSPTGGLHLGHAFAALFAHWTARRAGGRFRLRMEDLDAARCRPAHARTIMDDLRWLGLDWDGPVVRQSARAAAHRRALDRLRDRGLLYPCFCTRREIQLEIDRMAAAPHGPDAGSSRHVPVYPGTCRLLPAAVAAARAAAGEPHVLRLRMDAAADVAGPLAFHDHGLGAVPVRPALCGDVALARRDAPVSYHLAVAVDDAFQGVTRVTRGADLLPATHAQRVLQALLGLPAPTYTTILCSAAPMADGTPSATNP